MLFFNNFLYLPNQFGYNISYGRGHTLWFGLAFDRFLQKKLSCLGGWLFSKEEEKVLINLLSVLGPHGVIVNHDSGNDEAYAFAEELVAAFKAIPDWQVGGSNFVTELGPRETGVFISVTDQGEVPQAAVVIMDSLKRQDIVCILKRVTSTSRIHLGPRVFDVFVRSRPE